MNEALPDLRKFEPTSLEGAIELANVLAAFNERQVVYKTSNGGFKISPASQQASDFSQAASKGQVLIPVFWTR